MPTKLGSALILGGLLLGAIGVACATDEESPAEVSPAAPRRSVDAPGGKEVEDALAADLRDGTGPLFAKAAEHQALLASAMKDVPGLKEKLESISKTIATTYGVTGPNPRLSVGGVLPRDMPGVGNPPADPAAGPGAGAAPSPACAMAVGFGAAYAHAWSCRQCESGERVCAYAYAQAYAWAFAWACPASDACQQPPGQNQTDGGPDAAPSGDGDASVDASPDANVIPVTDAGLGDAGSASDASGSPNDSGADAMIYDAEAPPPPPPPPN
jgi:hypothetical protein